MATEQWTDKEWEEFEAKLEDVNSWQDIACSPEISLLVAIGSDSSGSDRIMTSSNGFTWTTRFNLSGLLHGITWSSTLELFIAIGVNGDDFNITDGVILTSPNGINWTTRTSPSVYQWRGVIELMTTISRF